MRGEGCVGWGVVEPTKVDVEEGAVEALSPPEARAARDVGVKLEVGGEWSRRLCMNGLRYPLSCYHS